MTTYGRLGMRAAAWRNVLDVVFEGVPHEPADFEYPEPLKREPRSWEVAPKRTGIPRGAKIGIRLERLRDCLDTLREMPRDNPMLRDSPVTAARFVNLVHDTARKLRSTARWLRFAHPETVDAEPLFEAAADARRVHEQLCTMRAVIGETRGTVRGSDVFGPISFWPKPKPSRR